ncbi:MAG: protein translocase subunit SecD [Firmicutes bacterium]|nr:protein translocase subunit SecD [Bacillota bacterium]
MKKALAVAIVILTVIGWVFSVTGLDSIGSLSEQMKLGLDMIGGVSVVLEADTEATGSELKGIMDQTKAVMENRVNEMGLSEPVITIENENLIRIELPGAQNATEAIESIGKTAMLTFRTADGNVIIDGSHIKDAQAAVYQGYDTSLLNTYIISLEFDAEGSSLFEQATRDIVAGKIKSSGTFDASQIPIYLDDEVISAPMVTTVISSANAQITGRFTRTEAMNLAALIRGGSLPVTLNEVQTEIVGPTLGINAAQKSVVAGIIGIVLIFIVMIMGYKVMGVVADFALALYVLIVLWVFVGLKAVLTLPGIAGLILSVGMAVDSNVIIFTRIQEDIKEGKTVRVAVESGFRRGMGTIIDSQLTTIIAAVILYEFGTGSVRGFALTLLIGIIASLFTAVTVSKLLLTVASEHKSIATMKNFGVKTIAQETEGEKKLPKKYDFLGNRKKFYMISCAVIVLGIGIGLIRGYNLGIDFTGGTMLQLNMEKAGQVQTVEEVLTSHGIKADIQPAGENGEKVIIKTTTVIDNEQRQALVDEIAEKAGISNGRETIEQAGLIGPSVGDQLKANTFKSILLACLAMLIYIAVRFEWRFGVAAIIALLHDAAVLFAFYGLFHVQMNSPFIAGLLIIIGYSINDTIVVFDRVRENRGFMKKIRLETVINESVNQSISRAFMTSITTALAIIPLIIICGDAIRAFALPLLAGVLCGTFSSLCLASAFYYEIHRLTKKNRYRGA